MLIQSKLNDRFDYLNFFQNYISALFLISIGYYFYTQLSVYHIGLYTGVWEPQTLNWLRVDCR
ncbi:hypothetical protein BH11PSE12_BH11PSE12_27140 [soil metagenome]